MPPPERSVSPVPESAPLSSLEADKLVQIIEAAVQGSLSRRRRREDAKDDAQDIALSLLKRREADPMVIEQIENPSNYGYRAGRNRAAGRLRGRRWTEIPVESLDHHFDWGETPSDRVELAMDIGVQLKAAIDQLTPTERIAFEALAESGGNVREAIKLLAHVSGKRPATVRRSLDRARRRLRGLLEQLGEK